MKLPNTKKGAVFLLTSTGIPFTVAGIPCHGKLAWQVSCFCYDSVECEREPNDQMIPLFSIQLG